ncbi:MAG: DMT family transporter [Clostridia bacterium]|nr:DMT family transporter [Clostridia bacterium]
MEQKHKSADLILLLVAASWGVSIPLTKLVIGDIGIFTLLFFRFSIGSLITASVFYRQLRKVSLKTVVISFSLALLMSTVNVLETWGLKFTTSTNAAFLSGLSLIIVPVISFFLYKIKPRKKYWLGLFLTLSGFYFLTAGAGGITSLTIGDTAIILSAFIYAIYIVLINHLIRKDESVCAGIFVLIFSAAIYFVLMFLPEPVPILASGKLTAVVLTTGLVCTAFAYSGHIFAQTRIAPLRASLIMMTEPIFTTIFSLVIPNASGQTESLTLFKIAGILLMTLGMLTAEFGHLSKN